MITLQSYKNDSNIFLTTIEFGKGFEPGCCVREGVGDAALGFGIIISVTIDEVIVLWSTTPLIWAESFTEFYEIK